MRHLLRTHFYLLVICLDLCSDAMAQHKIPEAVRLVDSANAAFCKNDTAATIFILENIERLYPTDYVVAISNKSLANFYLAQGRIKEAKEKLRYGIFYDRTTNSVSCKIMEGCPQIVPCKELLSAKPELCIRLSQLFLQEKQFDSSLYYLQQADTRYNPYQTCGNGAIMYRVYLTPYFADLYLTMGDTTKAINRLLDFFMMHDGDTEPVTKMLKALLLQKLTQQQLTVAVKRGLRKMAFSKDDENTWWLNITIFDHTIKIYVGNGGGNYFKTYRNYYRNDRSAKMLCDANALK